jgi:dihydroorotate dehydrogenase (fumarate)
MNLTTTYMGLTLRTPLVVSASPLSETIDNIRRMEAAGASAIVLQSLFEEQIRLERYELHWHMTSGTESYPEALSYFPDPQELYVGPEAYLKQVEEAKRAATVPVIASLNGSASGAWTTFAKQIQNAGADALELNLYNIPTDANLSGADLEERYLEIVRAVRAEITIPLAIKLSPFFTNMANMAKRLDESGANGLVLFNRFYQPDIDLESLEAVSNVFYSTPMAMRLPLRWIAILYDRVGASLAATGGIHRGTDALKMLMAGADVTMLCSVLMRHGIDHIKVIEQEMVSWLREHDYKSIEQLKGSLSHKNCPNPSAFERAQYMRAVGTRTTGW